MRKFIIDTDTAADDAVALLLALRQADIEILGITTVCGNVPLELATKNAITVMEAANREVPVFMGAKKPLKRELYTAEYVHGLDGLGDADLVHPKALPQKGDAVDFILDTVKKYKNEIEIIALGPATNIAAAILRDSEAMKGVKRIFSMGTAGQGKGNVTEAAEFNVYVDAESYDIMLKSGIPITVIGLDMCLGASSLTKDELEALSVLSDLGEFVFKCTGKIVEHNLNKFSSHTADIPDAIAVACVLWEETVISKKDFYLECSVKNDLSYGGVALLNSDTPNATVITEFDSALFKEMLFETLA